jgi:hypothetical protein
VSCITSRLTGNALLSTVKLGEALIKAGLITREQLQKALERQESHGGRIDTNIVELRFLSDSQLSEFLGTFLRMPVVTPEMIKSVPSDLIRILNRNMIEDYLSIPFKRERQRLHIAMLNPTNVRDIDNLRFVTDYRIIPYAITELQLLSALEKYYGITGQIRFRSLTDRFYPIPAPAEMPAKVERRSTKALASGKEKPSQELMSSEPKAQNSVKGNGPEPGEASIISAVNAAKQYYKDQGLSLNDSSIEDELIANWDRLSEKIKDRRN